MTERPNIIEWVRYPTFEHEGEAQCRLVGFDLANPKAAQLNQVFDHLGIDIQVSEGPSRIAVELMTPTGPWRIENPGISFVMPSMIWTLLGLWWRSSTRGKASKP